MQILRFHFYLCRLGLIKRTRTPQILPAFSFFIRRNIFCQFIDTKSDALVLYHCIIDDVGSFAPTCARQKYTTIRYSANKLKTSRVHVLLLSYDSRVIGKERCSLAISFFWASPRMSIYLLHCGCSLGDLYCSRYDLSQLLDRQCHLMQCTFARLRDEHLSISTSPTQIGIIIRLRSYL